MANSLEKFKLENKIRLLFFKHRGNLEKIAAEAQISIEYVKKIIDKFKAQQRRDPNLFVAQYFMEYIFMGSKERELANREDLEKIDGYALLEKSVCCDASAEPRKDEVKIEDNGRTHMCLKCGRTCRIYLVPNSEVFNLRIRLREEMRKDEDHLINAVSELGFGKKNDGLIQQVSKITQYNFVGQGKVSEDDQKVLNDISGMDPRSREKMRRDLQNSISGTVVDAEFEEKKLDDPKEITK